MHTTIDSGGRVVIPKPLRDALGLVPGDTLDIRETDGRIQLEPTPAKVRVEQRGEGLVAVAVVVAEPLTAENVRDLVERIRR